MRAAGFVVFLLLSSFVFDSYAYFRLPRMGESSEEYMNSFQEYRDAVDRHKQAKEEAKRRSGPLARSNGNGNGNGNGDGNSNNGNGNGNGNGDHGHGDGDGGNSFHHCSHKVMAERSQMYINGQPLSPNGWTEFFTYLHPDVILSSNLIDAPAGVGKAAIENLLLAINTQYQNITAILEQPKNTFGNNSIVSLLSKSQGSIRVGVQYNITIYQEMTFSPPPDCLVTSIFEFADSVKTAETLSLEFSSDPCALTCERIKWICGSYMPNFGTQDNNCMLLWKGTPAYRKNDTAMNDDLQLLGGRTLTCANTVLSTIQNAGAALPAAEVQYLCSLLGGPVTGLPGCW